MRVFNAAFENEDNNTVLSNDPNADVVIDNSDIGGDLLDSDVGLMSANDTADYLEENQEVAAVMESLDFYDDHIENLISTNKCSQESIDLITMGIQNQLNQIGYSYVSTSLESCSGDIVSQHQAVLEDLRDTKNRLRQAGDLWVKKTIDDFLMRHKDLAGNISYNEGKLETAEHLLKDAKSELGNDEIVGSLTSLWPFFTTRKGQTNNVIADTKHDLEMSNFITKTYADRLLALLGKVVPITKTIDLDNRASIIKAAEEIEKLKHPVELFDVKYLNNGSYFDSTILTENSGAIRKSIAMDGKVFSRLAELATTKSIVHNRSFEHNLKEAASSSPLSSVNPMQLAVNQVAGLGSVNKLAVKLAAAHTAVNIAAALADVGLSKAIKLKPSDLNQILKFSEEYIKSAGYFDSNCTQAVRHLESYSNYMEAITTISTNNPLSGLVGLFSKNRRLYNQIDSYVKNIVYCYNLVWFESYRALKGSRYSSYLVMRMIKAAKK